MDLITNGLKLDLKELPTQNTRSTFPLSGKESEIVSIGITKLLKKVIIVYSTPDEVEFV